MVGQLGHGLARPVDKLADGASRWFVCGSNIHSTVRSIFQQKHPSAAAPVVVVLLACVFAWLLLASQQSRGCIIVLSSAGRCTMKWLHSGLC
jgi:hypothetical protein